MFINFDKYIDVMNINSKFVILSAFKSTSPIFIIRASNINLFSKFDKCSVPKKCMEFKFP